MNTGEYTQGNRSTTDEHELVGIIATTQAEMLALYATLKDALALYAHTSLGRAEQEAQSTLASLCQRVGDLLAQSASQKGSMFDLIVPELLFLYVAVSCKVLLLSDGRPLSPADQTRLSALKTYLERLKPLVEKVWGQPAPGNNSNCKHMIS